VVLFLLPDEAIADTYQACVLEGGSSAGKYLGLAHGLCVTAGWFNPPQDTNVFLVAPKAQGAGVREKFLHGSGVPALVGVHQNPSGDTRDVALAYAKALGASRIGVLETTLREETVCDLFSEQVVLCGGLTRLITRAFETLTEAGYSPEVAAFECLYEVKLIADLLHTQGIGGMRQGISPAALFGDLTRGDRVIDASVKTAMQGVLQEIESGQFWQELKEDAQQGNPRQQRERLLAQQHPIHHTYEALKAALKF
jgi:ketol-acid reductoisomerase